MKLETPVLLITFNRPDVTKIVLDKIIEVAPPIIYIFNDAPRSGNENDKQKCAEIRQMVNGLSYDGIIKTRFEESNLGCKLGESTAMSWLFENEEMGIVIEDDILPTNEFFYYCQEMLLKYQFDERIFSITGCNLINDWKSDIQDYHFALFGSFWGWAGWRRAWKHYDVNMPLWKNEEVKKMVENYLPFKEFSALRKAEFDSLISGKNDTWDFQFCLAHLVNHAISIVPSRNLIKNIGINREDAVHMQGESPFSDLVHYKVNLPFKNNPIMIPDYEYDRNVVFKAYPWLFDVPELKFENKPTFYQKVKNKLTKL